ncbi:uncharacterized protein LOC119111683, partial [Pollicipes pollicipes]|uniref:uncharacterized protein LOC119111683 n=1 Tax=Pollicipes pollicipes TaxID=41117 RepID=UPI0018857482
MEDAVVSDNRPLPLRQIGQKYWLQALRGRVRLAPEPAGLWQLQRYLSALPAALRAEMLHLALAPSDAGDTDTRDQLTNTALVLLSAEVVVERAVYLSFPRPGQPPPADLCLVLRHGDGLRSLTVYVPEPGAETDVTVDGVLHVLETLPLLEHVGCAQTIALLEQLDVPAQFGLRELPEFQASGGHLRNFARLCPQLSSVTLVFQQVGVSLRDVTCLPQLQHLTFRCKDPYLLTQEELAATLWRQGHQLRTLAISGDVYETLDVALIAVYCPHLEVLKLPSLTLADGE